MIDHKAKAALTAHAVPCDTEHSTESYTSRAPVDQSNGLTMVIALLVPTATQLFRLLNWTWMLMRRWEESRLPVTFKVQAVPSQLAGTE